MTKPVNFTREQRDECQEIFNRLGINTGEEFLGDFSLFTTRIFDINSNDNPNPPPDIKTHEQQIEQLNKWLNRELGKIEKPEVKLFFLEGNFEVSIPENQKYLFTRTSIEPAIRNNISVDDLAESLKEGLKKASDVCEKVSDKETSFNNAFNEALEATKKANEKKSFTLKFYNDNERTLKFEFLHHFIDRLGYHEMSSLKYVDGKIEGAERGSVVQIGNVSVQYGNENTLNITNEPVGNLSFNGDINIVTSSHPYNNLSYSASGDINIQTLGESPPVFNECKFFCENFKHENFLDNPENTHNFANCEFYFCEGTLRSVNIADSKVMSEKLRLLSANLKNSQITTLEIYSNTSNINSCTITIPEGKISENELGTQPDLLTANTFTYKGEEAISLQLRDSIPVLQGSNRKKG